MHFDSFGQSKSGVAQCPANRHSAKRQRQGQTQAARAAATEGGCATPASKNLAVRHPPSDANLVDLLDHLLDGGDVQGFEQQQQLSPNTVPQTSKRPRRAAAINPIDYNQKRKYAGKNARWENLSGYGKANRITHIVDQLRAHAATEEAFDEMITRVMCNPRLASTRAAQAQVQHGRAELQEEICKRVKTALQELKLSKVTSTTDGYKVCGTMRIATN